MTNLVSIPSSTRLRAVVASTTLAVALVLGGALTSGCDPVPEPDSGPRPSATPDPTELEIEEVRPGTGDRVVKTGDKIQVTYVGKLLHGGKQFDANENKDAPFDVTVGEGVIEGWSKGLVGMKKGGKRKLTIPPDLAYGDKGSPPDIPANAPLVFDIELIRFADEAPAEPAASAEPAGSASATPSSEASADAAPSAAPAEDSAVAPKPTAPKTAAPKSDAPKPEAPKPVVPKPATPAPKPKSNP